MQAITGMINKHRFPRVRLDFHTCKAPFAPALLGRRSLGVHGKVLQGMGMGRAHPARDAAGEPRGPRDLTGPL